MTIYGGEGPSRIITKSVSKNIISNGILTTLTISVTKERIDNKLLMAITKGAAEKDLVTRFKEMSAKVLMETIFHSPSP